MFGSTDPAKLGVGGRRMHEIDGTPLTYWDKSNFKPERDERARVIYKPKEGSEFFSKHLRREDFIVMRETSIEQPFFSKYNRFYPKCGHFCCKACGNALYSHKEKLTRHDGWPAFGGCVYGAVAMVSAEERAKQKEKEDSAATRIQAFLRGCTSRAKVSFLVGKLIEREIAFQSEQESNKEASTEVNPISQSLHSLEEFSILMDSNRSGAFSLGSRNGYCSTDDEESFSGDSLGPDDREEVKDNGKKKVKRRRPSSVVEFKPSISKLDEDFVEIHCRRCGSHLGNIIEEENRGRDGRTTYKERHRVNGRSLKYVSNNLSKRIQTDSSLLPSPQTSGQYDFRAEAFSRRPKPGIGIHFSSDAKPVKLTKQEKGMLEDFCKNAFSH